jgi:hypothetical protein
MLRRKLTQPPGVWDGLLLGAIMLRLIVAAISRSEESGMEIITTCIDCWQPSAAFVVNCAVALAALGVAVWRTA